MVDAPCSRIGHIYRKFAPFPNPGVGDFVGRVSDINTTNIFNVFPLISHSFVLLNFPCIHNVSCLGICSRNDCLIG